MEAQEVSTNPQGPPARDSAQVGAPERVRAAAELLSEVSRDLMGPSGPEDAAQLRSAVEGLTRVLVAAGDIGVAAGEWVRRADVVGRASGYERVDKVTHDVVRRLGYWTRSTRAIAEDVQVDLAYDARAHDELDGLLDRHGYVTEAVDEAGL